MADDALKAWTADRAAGADALLIADRWEVADAINERIHRQAIGPDAPTITVARRHKIGVGDTIITRHNDLAITVYDGQDKTPIEGAPVRNGQRWEVVKIDVDGDRIAARRIGDGALTVLAGEYLHKHVHLGYAVTVHAAQGVTADRCHALLSPAGTRSAAYVAMTRGRQTNQVYLYEQAEGEADHEHGQTAEGQTVAQRGTDQDAAEALSRLLDRDNRPLTVVDVAEDTPARRCPSKCSTCSTPATRPSPPPAAPMTRTAPRLAPPGRKPPHAGRPERTKRNSLPSWTGSKPPVTGGAPPPLSAAPRRRRPAGQ